MTVNTLILKNTKITNKGIREHIIPWLSTLDRPFKILDLTDCLGLKSDVEDDFANAVPYQYGISIKAIGTDFS